MVTPKAEKDAPLEVVPLALDAEAASGFLFVIWMREKKSMFSQSTIEQLGFYVYLLRDPRDRKVFYVGKGKGNRVFAHAASDPSEPGESEKLARIRDIEASGAVTEHFVLRHGLTEESAFEVEAAVIDLVGMDNLSNVQNGHYSTDYGIMSPEEVEAMYSASPFATTEPVILININKLFNREMTTTELYEATRKAWVVGANRDKAKYAIATYRGLTREVYKIEEWYPIGDRWGFNGSLADNAVRETLRHKSIAALAKRGAANPIRYINC